MRKVLFEEQNYYHLFNRGVDKRVIFSDERDFERFKAYLYLLNNTRNVRPANIFSETSARTPYDIERTSPLVAIGAYCLLPSHFHLLVTPLVADGIPKFMHKLQTAYTMYFNKRTSREGSLLQGTYKAHHIATDQDLEYMFAYIHLKPQKILERGTSEMDHLADASKQAHYPHSSLAEYTEEKNIITSPQHFPSHFSNTYQLDNNLRTWITYRE